MLDNNQIALLELLKISLLLKKPVLPTALDWNAILTEAKAQTVVALAAKAAPQEAVPEWQESVMQCQAKFIRVMHGQAQLVKLFEQAGIPMVILKGTAAAVYYPEPFRRAMGDIDYLVPQDRQCEALRLMEENGYQKIGDGSRHTSFQKAGLEFELHYRFSYPDLDIEDIITNGLTHSEYGVIGGNRFPMLPRLANGMVLLAHLRTHLKSGIGLRHIIDWMMYVDKELDDEFWRSEFRQAVQSKGMEKLAVTITRMCQIYLGLSERLTWCASADDELCEKLLESIFKSGYFGQKNSKGFHFEYASTRIRSIGVFRYLQSAGELNWDAYYRHHILKPFCWAYQICRITKRGLKAKRGMRIMEDIDRSKDRYELLKELGIM